MGIFDSLINGGFNSFNAAMQYNYQKRLQENAYHLTMQGYRETPSAQRHGLESAGYNPILAVSNGVSYGGNFSAGSATGATGNPASGIDESITNAYKIAKLEKPRNQAEINSLLAGADAQNANASLAREQAITEEAKRINLQFQNSMLDVQKHLAQKDLDWYDRKAYTQIYELMQRAENYRAMQSIESFNAQTNRQNAVTNAKNANTSVYESETNRINAKTNVAKAIGTGVATGIGLGAIGLNKLKFMKKLPVGFITK